MLEGVRAMGRAGDEPESEGLSVSSERVEDREGTLERVVGGGGGALVGGGGGRGLGFAEGTDKLEGGIGLVTVRVGSGSRGRAKGVAGEFCRDKDSVGRSPIGCKESFPIGDGGAEREPREKLPKGWFFKKRDEG